MSTDKSDPLPTDLVDGNICRDSAWGPEYHHPPSWSGNRDRGRDCIRITGCVYDYRSF